MASACSKSLPEPAFVAQPTSALIEVPFPPPPAKPETVPPVPNKTAIWLDGEWVWQIGRYAWKTGRWLNPPPNGRYSPWTSVRGKDGTYFVAAGAWRDSAGNEIEEPASLSSRAPEPDEPSKSDASAPDANAPHSSDPNEAGANEADADTIGDAALPLEASL